jgi:hypothetical protein
MIVVAPTARAAMMAASPTAPDPNAAKLAPWPTFSAFVGERKRREGRLAEKMIVDEARVILETAAAVGAPAAEIMGVEVFTIVRPSLNALPAGAAGHEAQDHVVARPHLDDARADLLDNASALVSEHDRLRHRIHLVAHDHVGVAHAGGDDTHKHFVVARLAHAQFFDGEGPALVAHHSGSHGIR